MGSRGVDGDGVNGYFASFYPFFCSHTSGVVFVVFFYKFCGVKVLFQFPTVMGIGISFPFDQELGLILIASCVHYLIYFPLWFSFYVTLPLNISLDLGSNVGRDTT